MKNKRGKRRHSDDSNNLGITYEKVQLMVQEMSNRLDSLEQTVCCQFSDVRENSTIQNEISEHLQLETICAPLFSVTPNPTTIELNRLVRENQNKFKTNSKELKKLVRKWFRLKRQEAGRKLAPVYQGEIVPILSDSNTIENIIESIRSKGELFCRIRDVSQESSKVRISTTATLMQSNPENTNLASDQESNCSQDQNKFKLSDPHVDNSGNMAVDEMNTQSALYVLSQAAFTETSAMDVDMNGNEQTQGNSNAQSTGTMTEHQDGTGQSQPKRQINFMAMVMYMQSLEDRIRVLEQRLAISSRGSECGLSPNELPSPAMLFNRPNSTMFVKPPFANSQQPNQPFPLQNSAAPQAAPLPASLTSITINGVQHKVNGPCSSQGIQSKFKMSSQGAFPNATSSPTSLCNNPQVSLKSPPVQPIWNPQPAMVLKDATVKDIQKSKLDFVCIPLLEQTHEPTKIQLLEAVCVVERLLPTIDRRIIMSAIRKWFRKRREEMGTRVFMLCKTELMMPLDQVHEFLRTLMKNTDVLDRIRMKAGIEIKNEASAREFVAEKIESYFRRMVMAISSPKLGPICTDEEIV